MDIYTDSILLIGPPNVGKSEISTMLSDKTGLPTISLESTRDKYYKELGYDKKEATRLKNEEGVLARYKYLKKFEAYHISKYIPTIKMPSIIKFEATQTVYEDNGLFRDVKSALNSFKNIVLLLPDIDLQDCWTNINKTGKVPLGSDISKLNWHLISSPCNTNLATITICTYGKTKEEVVEEILKEVEKNKTSN